MSTSQLGGSPGFKTELMFEGIRYSDSLGGAAAHSLPNYYPYRFAKDEPDPTGTGKAQIPYLMRMEDDTMIRIMGNAHSSWSVTGDADSAYTLTHDDGRTHAISFEPLHDWMKSSTSDGFPMARTGVSTHGDMLIINVAPGCEYFLKKTDGQSMRCTFCSYGAPDDRTAHLGQVAGQVEIPDITLARMQETMSAVMQETEINHIYLVGGSLTDPALEGERFLQLARAVKSNNPDNVPVCLGSGALPEETIRRFSEEQLVDAVCFNLEIWSKPLFQQVCPGKNRYVGYDRWIELLEYAVGLWGPGRVYSAMVAGIELEPEHGLQWQQAADLAVKGAAELCSKGIIPIYSLYWPTGGKERSDYQSRLKNYFESLVVGYRKIRRDIGLEIWDGFMCHRCAYMQLECDVDRA